MVYTWNYEMPGYKVTDYKRSRIVGVACSSLKQLKEKGCHKLELKAKKITVQLQDGTYIDDEDYFQTIPPQTLLILVQPGEYPPTGSEIIYNALCAVHSEYLKAGKLASAFFSTSLKRKVTEIASIVNDANSKGRAELSKKEEDPEWFEGLDTNCSTKEDFMKRRSQQRVRGYLYNSQQDIRQSDLYRSNPAVRLQIDSMLATLKKWLTTYNHFGCFFDRRMAGEKDILKKSYCNSDGLFICQGQWNEKECGHLREDSGDSRPTPHVINPYESRATRIVFSTWNLDHRIERSRRIGPALLTAASLAVERNEEINADYFFCLLFTPYNLKLVHVVCHDKGEHLTALCKTENFTTKKSAISKPCNPNKITGLSLPYSLAGLAK